MKRTEENIVSSFFYYMWCRWSREECDTVFGGMSEHFWSKWCRFADKTVHGAAECFYAVLGDDSRRKLIARACLMYDGKHDLPTMVPQKPEEEAEVSEMLQYLTDQLRLNQGDWDLTNDEGKATVFDAKKEIYISDIILSKDHIPCAVIPMECFCDDTIQAVVNIVSL